MIDELQGMATAMDLPVAALVRMAVYRFLKDHRDNKIKPPAKARK
jgi:hypothetical protein